MNNNSTVKITTTYATSQPPSTQFKKNFLPYSFKEILFKKSAQTAKLDHAYVIKLKPPAPSYPKHVHHKQKQDSTLKQEESPSGQCIIPFNHDKHAQSHVHIFGHAKSFFQNDDEISRIFKKIVLNFNTGNGESHFEVPGGIFKGIRFTIKTSGQNLSLGIFNADKHAQSLIVKNKSLLQSRLLRHEIQLQELLFSS